MKSVLYHDLMPRNGESIIRPSRRGQLIQDCASFNGFTSPPSSIPRSCASLQHGAFGTDCPAVSESRIVTSAMGGHEGTFWDRQGSPARLPKQPSDVYRRVR